MSEFPQYPYFSHPTGGTTRLILIRHGQTAGNAQKLLHGKTDLPLSEIGLMQAERAAERIQREFDVEAIVSSPLQRASVTASIIGDRVGVGLDHEHDLVEMDFGDLEGISVEQLFARHPEIAQQAFDPSNQSLQWPNGESRSGFHQRVARVFTHLSQQYEGKTTVVVSHNGVLGSFLAQVRGEAPDNWQAYRLANCAVSSVEVVSNGTIVHSINDYGHLDGLVTMIVTEPATAE